MGISVRRWFQLGVLCFNVGRDCDYMDSGEGESTVNEQQERDWKSHSTDYSQRFCGHCNTTTDIKEANFIGE